MSINRPLVLLVGSAEVGGTEKQVVRLARELNGNGTNVQVWFTNSGGPLTSTLSDFGIHYIIFNICWKKNPIRATSQLIKMALRMQRSQPFVIYAFLAEAVLMGLTLGAVFCPKAKLIAGLRGEIPYRGRLVELLIGHALRKSHLIICNAHFIVSQVADRFDIFVGKIKVVSNGVDTPKITANIAVEPPNIVVIANFHHYKGHKILLDVLAQIEKPYQLRLCGGGPQREKMVAYAQKIGLTNRVTFVAEPANIEDEIQLAQFAIHPSLSEGLSNAILEEQSYGLPVVAFRVGGNSELINHRVNGLLYESTDIAGFRNGIIELIEDPVLRLRLSKEAIRSSQAFSWENVLLNLSPILLEK